MKHRIIIEYETPENPDKSFSPTVASMHCRKALAQYLEQHERMRLASLEKLFKVVDVSSEYRHD